MPAIPGAMTIRARDARQSGSIDGLLSPLDGQRTDQRALLGAALFSHHSDLTAGGAVLSTATIGNSVGHSEDEKRHLENMRDSHSFVRAAACRAMAASTNPEVTERIRTLLLTDPDLDVRAGAAYALGASKELSAVTTLIEAYQYKRSVLPESTGVRPLNEEIQKSLTKLGAKVGEPAIGVIWAAWEKDPIRLSWLFRVLREIGAPVEQDLLRALNHKEPRVRAGALTGISLLGRTETPVIIAAVKGLLSDNDPSVKSAALSFLFDYRAAEEIPLFKEVLTDRNSRDPHWQGAALALGQNSRDKAFEVLSDALTHQDPEIRLRAVFGLRLREERKTLNLLKKRMPILGIFGGENDPKVRSELQRVINGLTKKRALA